MFDDYRALFDSASKKQLSEAQRSLVAATVVDLSFVPNPQRPRLTAARTSRSASAPRGASCRRHRSCCARSPTGGERWPWSWPRPSRRGSLGFILSRQSADRILRASVRHTAVVQPDAHSVPQLWQRAGTAVTMAPPHIRILFFPRPMPCQPLAERCSPPSEPSRSGRRC